MLHASPAIQYAVLALPLLVLLGMLIRPGIRAGGPALEATALTVVVMIATFAVTLFGDGLADTAKQGHLVINAALVWLVSGLIMRIPPGRRPMAENVPGARVGPPLPRDSA